ncbi:hypothetical protein [Kordiimonas marina]|uniref:hypothetical protein n=1 Tax=Kordiimonas marina TaxID=2872312 RepID=UPI001FF67B26|nr:hypothetical protein [Kordiimonas marina]MCJ9428666.1 hypothetical protein [Kordiimonas marina]
MISAMTGLALLASSLAPIQDGRGHVSSPESLTIYWPIAYSSGTQGKKTAEALRFERLLGSLSLNHRIHVTPIRRAYHLYVDDPNSCVIFRGKPILGGELTSRVFAIGDYWLYVRKGAGFKRWADLKSAGTLEGAERYTDPEKTLPVTWRYAPSYEALIAMVESGRVDAVTLGPPVENGLVKMPDNLVRLGDKPFVHLELRLHCHHTPAAVALIGVLDKIVAEKGLPPR